MKASRTHESQRPRVFLERLEACCYKRDVERRRTAFKMTFLMTRPQPVCRPSIGVYTYRKIPVY